MSNEPPSSSQDDAARLVGGERSVADRRAALQRGADAEQRVALLLEEAGWQVLARNWRARGGEIDIISLKDGRLRLVEVKQRGAGDPVGLDAVGATKRARLVRAGEAWLAQTDVVYDEVCFAVAWLEGDRLLWIDNAFDAG